MVKHVRKSTRPIGTSRKALRIEATNARKAAGETRSLKKKAAKAVKES